MHGYIVLRIFWEVCLGPRLRALNLVLRVSRA